MLATNGIILLVFYFIGPILSLSTPTLKPSWAKCKRDYIDENCPVGWSSFKSKCYQFVSYPKANYLDAKAACALNGARLLRIDTIDQNEFVTNWISNSFNDQSMTWYTAGVMNLQQFATFRWEGHPSKVAGFSQSVNRIFEDRIPPEDKKDAWDQSRNRVIYQFNGKEFAWYISNATAERAYICEVELNMANKMIADKRTPDYGVEDLNNVIRGPCIRSDPGNPWYVASLSLFPYVVLKCVAYGNPAPTYKWFTLDQYGVRTLLDPLADKTGLISQTGGKLVLHNPNPVRDSAKHQCEATNSQGSVLSRTAQIVFGILDEFEKQPRDPIRRDSYQGVILECKPPRHQPEDSLTYSFYMIKGDKQEPIDPILRKNLFVSQARGELGFSEVTTQDNGTYICMISMTGGSSDAVLRDSRKSPDIPLIVTELGQPEQKVIIQDGFPTVKPGNPSRGNLVRLECFAYGPSIKDQLKYTWTRGGLQMPKKAFFKDFNRVLFIPNVQREDRGTYTCQASDYRGQTSEFKSVYMSFKSEPYYIVTPQDQFVDLNAEVKLICEPGGEPPPTIKWYKNSQTVDSLSNSADYQITEGKVSQGVLTIAAAKKEHEGMYGCEASNDLGSEFSYSELRVLNFAPSFAKYPLLPLEGMVGGNAIVVCRPEGAPVPTIVWKFNGTVITTNKITTDVLTGSTKCESKYCIFNNNNLYVKGLVNANMGFYSCEASNSIGKAESSAFLEIVPKLTVTLSPSSRIVQVNTTVDIPCRATTTAHLDINYAWFFEGIQIKFDRMDIDARRYELAQYDRPYTRYFGNLRLRNIQYENDGNYSCVVQTSVYEEENSAVVRVAGPPGPCAGVVVGLALNESTTVPIQWVSGANHYAKIEYFVIDVWSALDLPNKYKVMVSHLPDTEDLVSRTLEDGKDLGRRSYLLKGLAANIGYQIRVRAANKFGLGEPSPASDRFTTYPTKPTKRPLNVTGGGGKEGTLVIRWDKIEKVDENADGFFYKVGYREKGNREFDKRDFKEAKLKILEGGFLEVTFVVGSKKPYAEYQAQVKAVNLKGEGPWSEIVDIRSAENVPASTPENVQAGAFNSTALVVSWTPPILPSKEGKLLGYRIVYWPRNFACTTQQANEDRFRNGQRQTIFGEKNEGNMIGLDADTYYCIAVQVFNAAGDGPRSGYTEQTTFKQAPQNFPTKVTASISGRPNEIRIDWVGLQARPQEESLDGYKIRYWQAGAALMGGTTDVDCGLVTHGLIQKISTETRMNVRVFGYSRGGVGKMSSPMLQFMIVPASKCYKDQTYDGPDIRYVFICNSCNIRASATVILLGLLLHWFISKKL